MSADAENLIFGSGHLKMKISSRKPHPEELPVGRKARRLARGRVPSSRSVVAKAAYRSGQALQEEHRDITFDYSRKQNVVHTEIMAPPDAPEWVQDRQRLWNEVENASSDFQAQLAREVELSLPRELTRDQQKAVVREFVSQNITSQGAVADIAIHDKPGDHGQNTHAHILITMRRLTEDGFERRRERGWDKSMHARDFRRAWQEVANKHLEAAGTTYRVHLGTIEERRELARFSGDYETAISLCRPAKLNKTMAQAQIDKRGAREAFSETRAVENLERRERERAGLHRHYEQLRRDLAYEQRTGLPALHEATFDTRRLDLPRLLPSEAREFEQEFEEDIRRQQREERAERLEVTGTMELAQQAAASKKTHSNRQEEQPELSVKVSQAQRTRAHHIERSREDPSIAAELTRRYDALLTKKAAELQPHALAYVETFHAASDEKQRRAEQRRDAARAELSLLSSRAPEDIARLVGDKLTNRTKPLRREDPHQQVLAEKYRGYTTSEKERGLKQDLQQAQRNIADATRERKESGVTVETHALELAKRRYPQLAETLDAVRGQHHAHEVRRLVNSRSATETDHELARIQHQGRVQPTTGLQKKRLEALSERGFVRPLEDGYRLRKGWYEQLKQGRATYTPPENERKKERGGRRL